MPQAGELQSKLEAEARKVESQTNLQRFEKEITIEQQERGPETKSEQAGEQAQTPVEHAGATFIANAAHQAPSAYAQREKQVEKILEEGLAEMYTALPPDKKVAFKKAGEHAAKQINRLLSETRVKIKKIITLIREWLKLMPGASIFFVEQEAKIKADEIIKLNQQK